VGEVVVSGAEVKTSPPKYGSGKDGGYEKGNYLKRDME